MCQEGHSNRGAVACPKRAQTLQMVKPQQACYRLHSRPGPGDTGVLTSGLGRKEVTPQKEKNTPWTSYELTERGSSVASQLYNLDLSPNCTEPVSPLLE
jgi:hypothetical protein